MRPEDSAFYDPVVEEVRQIRAKLWKEAGGTVEGLRRLVESIAQENGSTKKKPLRKKHSTRKKSKF